MRQLRCEFVLALFLGSTLSQTVILGMNEESAKSVAATAVRKAVGLSETTPLRVTRREEWEDYLFSVQTRIPGQLAKAAYFFVVTRSGHFVLSPTETVVVTENDGRQVWVVGVSSEGHAVFRLYGFTQPHEEFEGLVAAANVRLGSIRDAETFAELFFSTTLDPQGERIVRNSLALRHRIEEYYFVKHGEQSAVRRAKSWWKGFEAVRGRVSLGISARQDDGHYSVRVTHLMASEASPQLVDLELTLDHRGRVLERRQTVLYSNSEGQPWK